MNMREIVRDGDRLLAVVLAGIVLAFLAVMVVAVIQTWDKENVKVGCALLGYPDGDIKSGKKICLEYHDFDGAPKR